MTDQLISLETAILAKEKGFDWECIWMYTDQGEPQNLIGISSYQIQNRHKWLKAPTQSLLQKWLRDRCIFITVDHKYIGDNEWVFVYKVDYSPEKKPPSEPITDQRVGYTYEEALEVGLKYSLNLL